MKAIQSLTTNILKTMKTFNHFLPMTLSMLLHLINPLIPPLSPPQRSPNKSNTSDNIPKQQPTQFPPRIPSLQPPTSILSAPLQTAMRSVTHLCTSLRVTHFHSALKIPNQSTGPPTLSCDSFPCSSVTSVVNLSSSSF